MNKKLLQAFTIALLTHSIDAKTVLEFIKKDIWGTPPDHTTDKIIAEPGDESIGEVVYHIGKVDPHTGKTYEEEGNLESNPDIADAKYVFDNEY